MTNGIDVSSSQAGISFSAVKSAGYSFVIVKAGGYNVKPEYVAPHYHEQIDGARAAGLHLGHYWIVGSGDPVQEADYFASILYGLNKNHDILALDNERLDSNPALWTDGNVAKFFTELHKKTGIPYNRMWFYIGAYNASVNTWTATKKLGVKTWIASYGADDGNVHTADTGGKLPVDVQQYTDKGRVGGYTVDLSYSEESAAVLFNLSTPTPTPTPAVSKPGKIAYTLGTGIPNSTFYKRLQWYAHLNGYTGPIDGKMGPASWKGVQRGLTKNWKYTGPIDGVPAVNTYKALQRFAQHYGYTGPIDGVLGANSYRFLSRGLNAL